MLIFRPTLLLAATLIGATLLGDGSVLASDPQAATAASAIPLPRQRPGNNASTAHTATKHEAQKPASKSAPLSIAPAALGAITPLSVSAQPANAVQPPFLPQAAQPLRPAVPFAIAPTATTPPMDLSAVKQAIDLVGKNRQDEATNVESLSLIHI